MTNIPLPPSNAAPLPAPRRRPYTPSQVNRGSIPAAPGQRMDALRPMPVRVLPIRAASQRPRQWLMIAAALVGVLAVVSVLFVGGVAALGPANLIYGSSIVGGVRVGGVAVGRMREEEAAQKIAAAWTNITLAAPASADAILPPISLSAAELGLSIDPQASAARAYAEVRSQGSISGLFASRVDVPLSASINADTARAALTAAANQLTIAPVNAGVALVNGKVQPTAPRNGLSVDIEATLAQWTSQPQASFDNGTLYVVVQPIAPQVADSSPLLAQAEALLTRSLDLRVYDPVTDDTAYWSLPPEQWGNWLTANSDPNSPIGLSLQLSDADLRNYLTTQAATALDPSRTIDVDQAAAAIQAALAAGTPDKGAVILKHQPRTHVVEAGETMMTIGYDFGVPYLYIEAVNPGVDQLSVGQTINIPPADQFLLLPVVPNKRIVVSISNQTVQVFENGSLKWDWKASTGIASSPTWPGVYQVLEHDENAWASLWQLSMPKFIGFYRPIPNSLFINGLHGYPTRNGGQLLWANSIGMRVTYGCVLLDTVNIGLLYDWAEDGTVVEVLK